MNEQKMPAYGGQALIEGVLMRGANTLAAAMRAPNGKIEIVKESLSGIYRGRIRQIPVVRGLIGFWDALGLGTRFLTISANLQTQDDQKIEGASFFITMFVALTLAIGVFFLAPAALGQWLEKSFRWSSWTSNILEGFVRLVFLILYLLIIGRLKDIQRVFAYHGAEHKTINAFEDGAILTPEVVDHYSVEHPRCGTGFLLTVAIFSIILFTLLGPLPTLWRLATRVILIPVIAGLAYEYVRWTANHMNNPFVAWMVRPNLVLQRLTTRQPDQLMLEVAITAFTVMYQMEKEMEGVPSSNT